jgi:hypothetical protein
MKLYYKKLEKIYVKREIRRKQVMQFFCSRARILALPARGDETCFEFNFFSAPLISSS